MTVRQIAELAKVSPATVSLVLNNKPGVSAQRRREIQKLLEDNGFTIKSRAAKPAPLKQLYIVKCRILNEKDEFSIGLIDSIEEYANKAGYTVSILNIDKNTYEQKLSLLDYSLICGIIFFASEMPEDCLNYTLRTPVPTVYVDVFSDYHAINTVNADQRLISTIAAQHLFNLGHRKIGYLKSSPERGYLDQRFCYFKAALTRLGAELMPDCIFNINLLADNLDELMPDCIFNINLLADNLDELILEAFRNIKDFPTAVFAESDVIAASCIQVLTNMGFSIPEDISVMAVDNTKICTITTPKLTSIDVNTHELGRLAFERIAQLIEDPGRPVLHSYVTPFLARRGSTANAKTGPS